MTVPAFLVVCDTCAAANEPHRWRQTCDICADLCIQNHQTMFPGHVVTLTETQDDTPPANDRRTNRLTSRGRGW